MIRAQSRQQVKACAQTGVSEKLTRRGVLWILELDFRLKEELEVHLTVELTVVRAIGVHAVQEGM